MAPVQSSGDQPQSSSQPVEQMQALEQAVASEGPPAKSIEEEVVSDFKTVLFLQLDVPNSKMSPNVILVLQIIPLTRVKKLIKQCPDVKAVSTEASFAIGLATVSILPAMPLLAY